jgi:hypothetical protein
MTASERVKCRVLPSPSNSQASNLALPLLPSTTVAHPSPLLHLSGPRWLAGLLETAESLRLIIFSFKLLGQLYPFMLSFFLFIIFSLYKHLAEKLSNGPNGIGPSPTVVAHHMQLFDLFCLRRWVGRTTR